MELFSHRTGIKPQKAIQFKSIDDDLKNRLWNVLHAFIFDKLIELYSSKRRRISISDENLLYLIQSLWDKFFKKPVNNTIRNLNYDDLYDCFLKQFSWDEIFDFIEFIVMTYSFDDETEKKYFVKSINGVLEDEKSAYRLIDSKITDITSKEEIEEIKEAMDNSPSTVKEHLRTSLTLYSDRKNPDYRNSIKESISAVESICKLIVNDPKQTSTLGKALTVIEKQGKIKIHHALKEGYSSIYGYTNDADGIRHGLKEETNLSFEDARYMLISCSAFINYLKVKASKQGIKLS